MDGWVYMGRPARRRRVDQLPFAECFKPRGIPMSELEEVVLTVDEFEAVRLGDLEGMYHAEAAARMGVSRQTFGRIIGVARRKIAEALVVGKALRIEGGSFQGPGRRLGGRGCEVSDVETERPADIG